MRKSKWAKLSPKQQIRSNIALLAGVTAEDCDQARTQLQAIFEFCELLIGDPDVFQIMVFAAVVRSGLGIDTLATALRIPHLQVLYLMNGRYLPSCEYRLTILHCIYDLLNARHLSCQAATAP
jgi:hypothetical protein